MNITASIGASILLHGAVAVAVLAAPAPSNDDLDPYGGYLQPRVVEFDHAATHRVRFVAPEPEPEPQVEPEAAPEPEPQPEPVKRRRPADDPKPNETAVVEDQPAPPPELRAVVASTESESKAEVQVAARADHGTAGVADASLGAPSGARRGADQVGMGAPVRIRSTPPPRPKVDRRALLKTWLKEIYREVQRHQRYPKAAQRARHEGKVVLAVWLAVDGTVKKVELQTSSGHASLDRAALRLVETVGRLPAPPAELEWSSRPIKLPVSYSLR